MHRNSLLGARIRLVSQTDLLVDPGGGAGIVRDEFFGFEPKADLVVGGLNRVYQTVKKTIVSISSQRNTFEQL